MSKPPKTPPSLSDQLVKHESDRGAVLVGLAVLDESLENLLRATFVQDRTIAKTSVDTLLATNGPLYTSWAKCHFANALGLLPECLFSDLDKMRKLRNRFAHQRMPVDFNNKEIRELIDGLSSAGWYHQKLKGKRYNLSETNDNPPSEFRLIESGYIKYSKGCFSICVQEALGYLENAPPLLREAVLS